MITKTEQLKKAGYNHIFVHTDGGCDVGKKDTEFACDDWYECIICGKRIKFLSTYDGHFQIPTMFYGRSTCDEQLKNINKGKTILKSKEN